MAKNKPQPKQAKIVSPATPRRAQSKDHSEFYQKERGEVLRTVPPKMSRAVARANENGVSTRNLNSHASSLRSLLMTVEDQLHGAILNNVYEPSRIFPLPSIYMPGTEGSSLFAAESTYGGSVLNPVLATPAVIDIPPVPTVVANGIDSRSQTYIMPTSGGDLLQNRYATFNGKSISTIELLTDANGELDVWFCHNPYYTDQPVVIFSPNDVVGGNYTNMTIHSRPPWTSDPFVFAKIMQAPQQGGGTPINDLPTCFMDGYNYYYPGSSYLQVETLNKNAWLSTSYQTRTGGNTVHRFNDSINGLYNSLDPGAPLMLLDQPSQADGAISVYMGQQWGQGKGGYSSPDVNNIKWQVNQYFRECWGLGAPWIRCVVRSQSSGALAAGPVQFKITLLTWLGIAPQQQAVAGACPMETVPFPLPTWARVLRTRGITYSVNSVGEAVANMQLATTRSLSSVVSGSTPLQRAIASAPVSTVAAIGASSPDKPQSWLSRFGNWVANGHAALDVVNELGSLGRRVSNGLKAIRGGVGPALIKGGPIVEEVLETAPLMIMP